MLRLRFVATRNAPSTLPTVPDAPGTVARRRKWALVVVVLLAMVLAAIVATPLWTSILVGIVLGATTRKPFLRLSGWLGGKRERLASVLVTIVIGLSVAAVGAFCLVVLATELVKLVGELQARGNDPVVMLGPRGTRFLTQLGVEPAQLHTWLGKQLDAAAGFAATLVAVIAKTSSWFVLGLVVSLLTMYYTLLEGPSLVRRLERILPLDPRHTRALLHEAGVVGRSAFVGTIFTAILQGAIAGAAYVALGVPQPMIWAMATALASLLPLIGTMSVWIPVAGWLALEGRPGSALLLTAWGFLVVTSLVDYVIRPRVVGRNGHAHPLLTLIALLGGLEVFGLIGLVVAPIIMSVFVAAFRLYEREMFPKTDGELEIRVSDPGAEPTPLSEPPASHPPALRPAPSR